MRNFVSQRGVQAVDATRQSLLLQLQKHGAVLCGGSPQSADLPTWAEMGKEGPPYPDFEKRFSAPSIIIDPFFEGRQTDGPPWGLDADEHDEWACALGGRGITDIWQTLWLIDEHLVRTGRMPGATLTQKQLMNPPQRLNWYDESTWHLRYQCLDATSWRIRTNTPVPGRDDCNFGVCLYAPAHNGLYLLSLRAGGNCLTGAIPNWA